MPTDPALPVSEQIVAYLATLLEGITVDADYSMNVAVERVDPGGNPKSVENADAMIALQEEFPEEYFDSTPGFLDGYRMRINIYAAVENNKKVTAATWGSVLHRIFAHVRQIVATDQDATRIGGYCLNATFAAPIVGKSLGTLPAIIVPLDVIFWTKKNDPNTAYKDIT